METQAINLGEAGAGMTYDEYLRRYSYPPDNSDVDGDDPDRIAESLAKATIDAFESALRDNT